MYFKLFVLILNIKWFKKNGILIIQTNYIGGKLILELLESNIFTIETFLFILKI